MKKLMFSLVLMLATAAFSGLYAQRETPAGAGDKNLADDGIKTRSVEIERIKREAAQAEAASFAPINKELKSNFPQIKSDFEGIQLLQSEIVKAYTTGKTIDYATIASKASEIGSNAKRLDGNLFADSKEEKAKKDSADKDRKLHSVRDLIIDLDNTIGSFVSSPIFAKIKVIEAEVAIKTRTDLLRIVELSEELSMAAGKMK